MKEEINIKNLELGYGSGHSIITDLSTKFTCGKIYGLLGLNGAGKTTLFKAISGLIKPKAGEIKALGFEPFDRKKEYLMLQMFVPVTARFPDVNLSRFAEMYYKFWPNFSMQEFKALMERFGLDPTKKLPTLSIGEQKKCMVAFALSANTNLLMLDEPMTGLDIISRKTLLEAIVTTQKPNRILIISSNQVEEFENIYTDILILYGGKLLINSSIDSIASRFSFHNQGMYPNTIFEDGLESICLNLKKEYTDVNLRTLFYAACSSIHFREILQLN